MFPRNILKYSHLKMTACGDARMMVTSQAPPTINLKNWLKNLSLNLGESTLDEDDQKYEKDITLHDAADDHCSMKKVDC